MLIFISFLLATLAALLLIPVAIFFIEVAAAIALRARQLAITTIANYRQRVAVLVPAHNESTGLLPTLADIMPQLHACDRLLVVADNCTDDTAALALAAGADVVSRNDPDRKGKGYALAWGLRHLALDPPDVVIVIDADCRVPDSAIERLAAVCSEQGRPVQAFSNMISLDESPINSRVAEFAWKVKNFVRPFGLMNLGLPCQLMGTGMALPWELIQGVDLASGSVVEDLKLGLDLALAGHPPIFCPFVPVTSEFPFTAEGVESQRLRWEQGHIWTILTAVPRLIFVAIARRNLDILALALDLAIPPLSLLGMLLMGTWVIASLATLLGLSPTAMLISTVNLVGFIGGVFISWLKYGRQILPPRKILLIPVYIIGKLPIYRQILLRKSDSGWTRADRRKV
jgi:cellulose synthase/poly-beta-1,6-N-acetylglucosamine synthase-like glycosyltransferase